MKWVNQLTFLSSDVTCFPPASSAAITDAEKVLGPLPGELLELLKITNGIVCRSFRLYSVFDRINVKNTWDSLQRANESSKTRALGGDPQLLSRFLVIADIGNGFAAWDRTDNTIWFEENDDENLHQTNLSLREFVELMILNVE